MANTVSPSTPGLTFMARVNGRMRQVSADSLTVGGGGANGTPETANTILDKLLTIDGAASGLDADLLDGQQGAYYLDFNNLINKPGLEDAASLLARLLPVDGASSGLDSDKLDGQEGAYYLNYNNLTNKPAAETANSVLTKILTVDGAASGLDADLLDGQQGAFYLDYNNFTNKPSTTLTVTMGVLSDADANTRPMRDWVREMGVSVIAFGADPTGVASSNAAFAAAIASGYKTIFIPAGTYKVTNIVVDKSVRLIGEGMQKTTINVTTTTTHGMRIIGESAMGKSNLIRLEGFKMSYTGTGQPVASGTANQFAGLYIQRKVYMDEVYIDGFTNDGIMFGPSDETHGSTFTAGTIGNAVFFSNLRNVWSKNNGRDGIRVRMGANANMFVNCQFDSNKGVGFHHLTDGGPTYGTQVYGGQAAYNSSYGYYFESGTDITVHGIYHEHNGTPTNQNTDSYQNVDQDVYVGDNISRSWINVGVLYSANTAKCRAPARGLNDSCGVFAGARRIFANAAFMVACETTAMTPLSGSTTVAQVEAGLNALIVKLQSANVLQ